MKSYHPDWNPDPVPDDYKEDLYKTGWDFFQDEKMQIDHDHIVNPLTSWHFEHACYMLFPLAESNIEEHMKRTMNCDGEYVRNLLKQLYGLSTGMAHVHERNPQMGATPHSSEDAQSIDYHMGASADKPTCV